MQGDEKQRKPDIPRQTYRHSFKHPRVKVGEIFYLGKDLKSAKMILPESVCVTGVVSTTRLPPSAENWMKFGREVGSDSSLRTENESPMCRMSKNEMESRVCKKI